MDSKLKIFFSTFYGFVLLISLRQIIVRFTGSLTTTQMVDEIILTGYSLKSFLVMAINPIIVLFCILSIFLVFRKKLPRKYLFFPVYLLALLFVWSVLVPEIISLTANSLDELLFKFDVQDKYWIIFSSLNFVFSSVLIYNLWRKPKKQKTSKN